MFTKDFIDNIRKNEDSFSFFFDDYFAVKSYTKAETDDYILISVVAPGQDKSKMKLQVKGNNLLIFVHEQRPKKFEIPSSVDLTDISAEYIDGILKIKLGKKNIYLDLKKNHKLKLIPKHMAKTTA